MPKEIIRKYPILIIGSGPAGCATALHLVRARPSLAGLILVLEKSRHPRPKVCAGGITARADELLRRIGAPCEVPAARPGFTRLVFENLWVRIPMPNVMRVVQRDEFDAALAAHVRGAGVSIREDEPAVQIRPVPGGMAVITDRDEYHARVVVGADGVTGVSFPLFGRCGRKPWAALTTEIKTADLGGADFDRNEVELDFTCLKEGMPGYIWRFPCIIDGEAAVNYGICVLRTQAGRGGGIARMLERRMRFRGVALDRKKLSGSFGWAYSPTANLARPHILVAGDTAGIDEMTGEGVRQSLMYGEVAAAEICRALDTNDYSFTNYTARVRCSELGRELAFSARLSRLQSPGAMVSLMDRIAQRASLGRALARHVSGERTIMKNPYPFAAHALAALGGRAAKLVKTIFQITGANF